MTTRSPTPQSVSSLLRRAGFDRARISRFTLSPGFKVTRSLTQPDAVRVEYRSRTIDPTTAVTRDLYLVKYRKALIEAGWDVFPGEYELTVTAGKEG